MAQTFSINFIHYIDFYQETKIVLDVKQNYIL